MIEIWAGIALLVVVAVHFGFQYMLKRLARMDQMRRTDTSQTKNSLSDASPDKGES